MSTRCSAGAENLSDGEIFEILSGHFIAPRDALNGAPETTRRWPHRGGIDQAESGKRHRQRNENIGEVAGPAQRKPAADRRDQQPREVGQQRPQQPAGALRGEIERHAEAEQAIDRADDVQIARPGIDHRRVVVEQRQPGARDRRRRRAPIDLAQPGRDRRADPRHAQGAVAPAGADIGSDHGDERAAEAEDERDQQIFEPRAGAVAGDGGRTEGADKAGGDGDGEIGLTVISAATRPTRRMSRNSGQRKRMPAKAKPHDAAPGAQISREHDAADRVIDQHRDRAAGDAEPRERAEAEDEARRQRNQHDDAGASHQRRHRHVAGAADHVGERIEQPDQNRAGEDHARNRSAPHRAMRRCRPSRRRAIVRRAAAQP